MNLVWFISLSTYIVTQFTFEIHSQWITWQKTYGAPLDYDEGYCIVQTPDSGYIAGGRKRINSLEHMYIFRLSKFGDLIWERTFPNDQTWKVIRTGDNNYLAMGVFANLVKLNASGDTLWKRGPYSAYNFTAIKETSNNGFVVCGSRVVGTNLFPYLLRINSQGELLWERTYTNGIFEGVFNDLVVENSSFVIGANLSDSGLMNRKLTIFKTDTAGNVIWVQKYDTLEHYTVESMIKDNDGNFVIAGGNNNFVSKYDQDGSILWLRKFDSFLNSSCRSICNTYDNNYIQAGWWDSNGSSSNYIRIRKIDYGGNEVWRKSFGFSGAENCRGISQTNDSGFVIAGWTSFGGGFRQDVFVVKTDKNGFTSPYISIQPVSSIVPMIFNFYTAFPNPFNPETILNFDIPLQSKVTLTIFDILGRKIELLINEELKSGQYSKTFDATNLPTGLYFAVLTAYVRNISIVKTQKLILIK